MIQSNELRIGNYLHDAKDNLCIIEALSKEEFNEIDAPVIKGAITSMPNKPIPLTEEWLLKFGFSDKDYYKGHIGIDFKIGYMTLSFVLAKPKHMGDWQNEYHFELREHRIVEIKYVHQLQNIFFVITTKELAL